MNFLQKVIQFVKDVAADPRIPERDKKVIAGLLLLIVSPVDIIPDWIPILGTLDDIAMLALILDYFFDVLDEAILLSHYPFGMKSFVRIRRFARIISLLCPGFLKRRIWKYSPSPYRK